MTLDKQVVNYKTVIVNNRTVIYYLFFDTYLFSRYNLYFTRLVLLFVRYYY